MTVKTVRLLRRCSEIRSASFVIERILLHPQALFPALLQKHDMHLHLFRKCKTLAAGHYKQAGKTASFDAPLHTGCTPLHDPPGRQVRECSPSKRYPGLQVKSHLESTSKPRVHVYLPCGIR